MRRKVVGIGNALGVTLPAELLSRYGLDKGDDVEVLAVDDHIEVGPARSVAELLDSWKPIGIRVRPEDLTKAIREDRDAR